MIDELSYEWEAQEIDANGDIQDLDYSEDLAELLARRPSRTFCLVRQTGNDDDGVNTREWAYLDLFDGFELEEEFTDGRRVPKKFHAVVARINRATS